MGEKELAYAGVKGEAVHAAARGEHEHAGGTVEEVACGHLLDAFPEHFFKLYFTCAALGAAVDGEDGADVHVDVHVGGTVKRIKDHDVVAALELGTHAYEIGVFLAGHGAHGSRARHPVDQDAVGEIVDLLLALALHVDHAGAAQDIEQAGLGDAAGYGFA